MSKITVMGSFIVDVAVFTPSFPRDGETVLGSFVQFGPGGKGSNQATAASRAGAKVVMITKVGTDFLSDISHKHYSAENMTQKYVMVDKEHETGCAIIEISTVCAENRIIVTKGANDCITKEDIDRAEEDIADSDIVLLQFETSMESIKETIRLAKKHGRTIVLNPAPMQPIDEIDLNYILSSVDYITPNETEAQALTGIEVKDEASAREAARVLQQRGVKNVIITMGKAGAYVNTNEGGHYENMIPSFKVKAVDTTGAGDAFNGGLCVALAEKKSIEESVIFANALAALSVTKKGTSPAMPYRIDIEKMINTRGEL